MVGYELMLQTLAYFILAIVLLVSIHEWGHFIVARKMGIQVTRFSIGFGPVLWRYTDKKGTEFALSLLPLGGYVKMRDVFDPDYTLADADKAFSQKPVWRRLLVILAGPFTNFVLALFLLWGVLIIGTPSFAPVIGNIKQDSVAAKAGLQAGYEIVQVNDTKVKTWSDVQYALVPFIGLSEPVTLVLHTFPDQSVIERKQLYFHPDISQHLQYGILDALGIRPFLPTIPLHVAQVIDDSPAHSAGFQKGDTLLTLNGQKLQSWTALVQAVRGSLDKPISMTVRRGGKTVQLTVTPKTAPTAQRGGAWIGLKPSLPKLPKSFVRINKMPLWPAFGAAFLQTYHLSKTTLVMIGRLLKGQVSVKAISGPVGIAEGAGASGRSGLVYYMAFLALISISLGVLNLLPLPMLDGGQAVFLLLEALRGKPLPIHVQMGVQYVGFMLLIGLSLLALFNDIMRLS